MKFTKEIKVGFLAALGIMMSVFSYNYLKGINLFDKNRKFIVKYEKKNDNILWTDKYSPKKVKDITSNKKILSQISKWLKDFPKVSTPLSVISGQHGVGKTISIKLLAEENNYEIIYFNNNIEKLYIIIIYVLLSTLWSYGIIIVL